jgi:hypothetical protein
VDDVLIFCNGIPRDTEKLAEILQLFKNATGMLINQQKSTLSATGMAEADIVFYKSVFPFHVQDVNEGLKYLGFLLKPNCYLKSDWLWLISKLEKCLKGWSFRWILKSGKTHPGKIGTGSYSNILDVSILDSKRGSGAGQEDLF